MTRQILFFCLFFIALISFSQAATIYGNVYGPDLNLLKYSIVEINSSPTQNMVAVNGNYSFNLAPGTYQIDVFYKSSQITLKTIEIITVGSEGTFVHDLILFETEDIENITFDEQKLINDTIDQSTIGYDYAAIIIIALSILILIFIYLIWRKRRKNKAKINLKNKIRKVSKKKAEGISNDEILNKIYAIIKREKRVNQKDIRKEIGMSEAKISLVIADLESRGLVKKIKIGRGNIIILQTRVE